MTAPVLDRLLALASGVLLALSFPRAGHPACAWIALVPLLVALTGWRGVPGRAPGQPPLRAFGLGLLTGTVSFVGTLYWTSTVVAVWGQLAWPLAILAMLLLALYLAVYPAVAALVTAWVVARVGLRGLLVAPAAWVMTEFARGHFFGGFPWVPLGDSQVTVLPIAQLASVLGVYGLSAFVMFVNAALAVAVLSTRRDRARVLAAAAVALIAAGGWGAFRIAGGRLTREGTPLRIGLVQPNIEQAAKWDPQQAYRIFTTHVAMTRDVVRRGAQYVLWPESATPFLFEDDPRGQADLRALAREVGVPILFGSDQVVRGRVPRMYNAAFLLDADGRTVAVYRKMRLVPFGEFIPLDEWLSFVSPIVDSLAEFVPGEDMVMLPVDGHLTSTAICYEVVYPGLVREAVQAGSELLTTITNDGWYGRSAAPYQHFALASMRAIEEGRYLARAANTGISGVVDPYGRVIAGSRIGEQVGIVADVRLLTARTIYSRVGDLVAWASMVVVAAALLIAGRSRR